MSSHTFHTFKADTVRNRQWMFKVQCTKVGHPWRHYSAILQNWKKIQLTRRYRTYFIHVLFDCSSVTGNIRKHMSIPYQNAIACDSDHIRYDIHYISCLYIVMITQMKIGRNKNMNRIRKRNKKCIKCCINYFQLTVKRNI